MKYNDLLKKKFEKEIEASRREYIRNLSPMERKEYFKQCRRMEQIEKEQKKMEKELKLACLGIVKEKKPTEAERMKEIKKKIRRNQRW